MQQISSDNKHRDNKVTAELFYRSICVLLNQMTVDDKYVANILFDVFLSDHSTISCDSSIRWGIECLASGPSRE